MELYGRDNDLNRFEQLLNNPRGTQRIFNIYGPAGKGKTVLGQACLDRAENVLPGNSLIAQSYIDLYDSHTHSLIGLIDAIIDKLIGAGKEGLTKSDFPNFFSKKAELANENQKGSDQNQPGILDSLQTRAIPNAFVTDLKRLCEPPNNRCIVLAFDTFEYIQTNVVGKWLAETADGLHIPGLICIVGGREKIVTEHPECVCEVNLNETTFSDQDVLGLLNDATAGIEPVISQNASTLLWATKLASRVAHSPLQICLARLAGLRPGVDLPQSDEELNQKLIGWLHPVTGNSQNILGDPQDPNLDPVMRQVIAFMTYLNKRFDEDLLNRLINSHYIDLNGVDRLVIWKKLKSPLAQQFMKERDSATLQLHDWLAEQGINYLFPAMFNGPKLIDIKQFCRDVVTWHDGFIDAADNDKRLERALRADQEYYRMNGPLLTDLESKRGTPEL